MTSEGLGEMFEGDSAPTCAGKFLMVSMGGGAEGLACADPEAKTPIGASGNFSFFLSFSKVDSVFQNFGYEFLGVGGDDWRWLCRHVCTDPIARTPIAASGNFQYCSWWLYQDNYHCLEVQYIYTHNIILKNLNLQLKIKAFRHVEYFYRILGGLLSMLYCTSRCTPVELSNLRFQCRKFILLTEFLCQPPCLIFGGTCAPTIFDHPYGGLFCKLIIAFRMSDDNETFSSSSLKSFVWQLLLVLLISLSCVYWGNKHGNTWNTCYLICWSEKPKQYEFYDTPSNKG